MLHKYLQIAAWLGALTVALGAFGAHALKGQLSLPSLVIFETAVRYQFYHVLALAITGLIYRNHPVKKIRYAANLFILGIIFFSGSLYLLALLEQADFKWIGAITPLGGACFIGGWVLLALGVKEWQTR